MKFFRIGLRLFSLPAGSIFKGQNMRVMFFVSLRVRCIVCSYTVHSGADMSLARPGRKQANVSVKKV